MGTTGQLLRRALFTRPPSQIPRTQRLRLDLRNAMIMLLVAALGALLWPSSRDFAAFYAAVAGLFVFAALLRHRGNPRERGQGG